MAGVLKRIAIVVALLVLAAAALAEWKIGWRNIVGMLRYDQRREGKLRVGDVAPDVTLATLDGGEARLSEHVGEKPLVLIFGSFT